MGNGPYGSKVIDPKIGAPQADICFQYKMALIRTTAEDRATREEEKLARRQGRAINPNNIQTLFERYLAMMPYKTTSARSHSFVVYFSNLQRLGWVKATGREDPSAFQDNYKPGPSRSTSA